MSTGKLIAAGALVALGAAAWTDKKYGWIKRSYRNIKSKFVKEPTPASQIHISEKEKKNAVTV